MAKDIKTITPGMSMPTTTRMYAQPLDVSGYLFSMSEAEDYAANSPIAYVGQVLTILVDGTPQHWYIADTNGTLQQIATAAIVQDIATAAAAGIEEMGYQGNLSALLALDAAKVKRGMIFDIDAAGLTLARQTYGGPFDTAETGDWIIVRKDLVSGWGSQADTYIGFWEQNLTGAVTALSGAGDSDDQYVSGLTKDGNTISVIKKKLPSAYRWVRTALTSDQVEKLQEHNKVTVQPLEGADVVLDMPAQLFVNGVLTDCTFEHGDNNQIVLVTVEEGAVLNGDSVELCCEVLPR